MNECYTNDLRFHFNGDFLVTDMESEPLVTTKHSRTMNYTSEDGSSILSPSGIEHDNLTSGTDKPNETEKFNYTTLERFHEDALQQV